MSRFEKVSQDLSQAPKTWLVTGCAGFIGSHLVEELLKLNQKVIGLDNFLTGFRSNLDHIKSLVSPAQWKNFTFVEGDITAAKDCETVFKHKPDHVLHQAALGSVPRSIQYPQATNHNNVTGFLNIIEFAKNNKVKSFVYASSSSVYGDHPDLPKVEYKVGNVLSPYAVSKKVNELYAGVFSLNYGLNVVGLRYFNVFGARQSPDGPYAAVIPKWINAMVNNEPVLINGDGKTSRDFCYVKNVVSANILAATQTFQTKDDRVFNIACGDQTSLNDLAQIIKNLLLPSYPHLKDFKPEYRDFRAGDIRHSLADVSKAKTCFGYEPKTNVRDGLTACISWYLGSSKTKKAA